MGDVELEQCPVCGDDRIPTACYRGCGLVERACCCDASYALHGDMGECLPCIRKHDPGYQPPCWACDGDEPEGCDECGGTGLLRLD